MKKTVVSVFIVLAVLSFGSSAFAANMVSRMATEKGGQHVAQCAQMMDKGVSACATGNHSCD